MKKLLFLLLIILCVPVAFGQTKPIIAIYVVSENTDNSETKAIKKVLEAKMVEAIDKSNLFTATERSEVFLAQINKEINYQKTGKVRDDQLTVLAKNSGAKYLCIADIVEVFNEKFVNARLLETESNNISGTASSSGAIKTMKDLTSICTEVANKLIDETPQGKAVKQINKEEQTKKFESEPFRQSIYSAINTNTTYEYNGMKYKGNKDDGLGAFYWTKDGNIFFGEGLGDKDANKRPGGKGIFIAGAGKNISNCYSAKYFVGCYYESLGKSVSGNCYDEKGNLVFQGKFNNDKPKGEYPSTDIDETMKFEILTSDGSKYIGETKNGKKHGFGISISANGNMWYGEWSNGKRTTNGTHIYKSGKTEMGFKD